MGDAVEKILWLRSWERVGASWMIRVACLRGGKVVDVTTAANILNAPRAFDIDAVAKVGRESVSVGLDVDDIASLSPLVDPSDVLGQIHPKLRESRHDLYVGYSGDMPIYIPGTLLIRTLWLWSSRLLPTLMTPNSLSLYLGNPASMADTRLIKVIGGLSTMQSTDTHLRRVAWLGLDASARGSWSSVLTAAYNGRLSLRLPHARMSASAWGVQVAGGVLVCELLSPHVSFWLPETSLRIQLGRAVRLCPPAPPFRYRTSQFGVG